MRYYFVNDLNSNRPCIVYFIGNLFIFTGDDDMITLLIGISDTGKIILMICCYAAAIVLYFWYLYWRRTSNIVRYMVLPWVLVYRGYLIICRRFTK